MKPVVIVGRPNVGKSTLFNRLVGKPRTIVHDRPGVTRDPVSADVEFGGTKVCLMDTGGFVPGRPQNDDIQHQVDQRVKSSIEQAGLILLVLDGRVGVSPEDHKFAELIRRSGAPVVGVVNKIDPGIKTSQSNEFYELGFRRMIEISAEHGTGIEELKEIVATMVREESVAKKEVDNTGVVKVAFVGRPNVGKSSLINAIVEEPRLIVSEKAGTTRDVVDIELQKGSRKFQLLDTAGIRRRHKVIDDVERHSSARSLNAIGRADVAILVLDSTEEITSQDERIAAAIVEKGTGILLVANKWDLKKDHKTLREQFREEIFLTAPFLRFSALKFVSAKTEMGLDQILNEAWRIHRRRAKFFSDEELEPVFDSIAGHYTADGRSGGGARLYGLMQGVHEPYMTFFVWCNDPRRIAPDYSRFFKNALGSALQLEGVPIRVTFRRRSAKALRDAREGPQAKAG